MKLKEGVAAGVKAGKGEGAVVDARNEKGLDVGDGVVEGRAAREEKEVVANGLDL